MKLFLLGLLIGVVLEYNYLLDKLDYRISFYGYHKIGDKVLPVIKLRRHIKGNDYNSRFARQDEGVELVIDKTVDFEDKDFDNLMRAKYCK